jgi:hypothetical protein
MVDTHTSNGADYPYTMTLIHTQADKLGYGLGPFLRETMLPHIYPDGSGLADLPYVNPVKDTPDDGIAEFLEVPRFSTGFAALHHVIGFMPETHMLKPFKDRYDSMRALLDVTMAFTIKHGEQIRQLRAARAQAANASRMDRGTGRWTKQPSTFRFKGYAAQCAPAAGRLPAPVLRPQQPWEKDIAYYNSFVPAATVRAPKGYIVPQAWREAIERLQWNGVEMARFDEQTVTAVLPHHSVTARHGLRRPYVPRRRAAGSAHRQLHRAAGRLLHPAQAGQRPLRRRNAGTARPRLLLPLGLLQQRAGEKGSFSDYVFEDLALECWKPSLN